VRRSADRAPRAIAGDQAQNFKQWPILVEITRGSSERSEQGAIVH
jgi:hypothetical protein